MICSVIRRYGGQGQKLEGGYVGVCLGLIDLTLPTLVSDYHHPEKLMWWAGISTSGKKISRWLGPNETMNSENFVRTMRFAGVPKLFQKNNLKLLQDNAPPHHCC